MSFHTGDGRTVDVEHATDAEFQAFIECSGIPVDDSGIVEWSFDDRCGVINHALKYDIPLDFVEPKRAKNNSVNNSENNSPAELFAVPEPAPEPEPA